MNVRATIEAGFEEEFAGFLGQLCADPSDGAAEGYRHERRERPHTATFGTGTVLLPRARIADETGTVPERWAKTLPSLRLTETATPVAAVHLAETDTRRVEPALFAPFAGTISEDVISRGWRNVRIDRDRDARVARADSQMKDSSGASAFPDGSRLLAHFTTAP